MQKRTAAIRYHPLAAVLIKFNTWQIDITSINHKTGYANIIQRNDWFAPECLAAVIRHPYF
jgi:hypothetical protein